MEVAPKDRGRRVAQDQDRQRHAPEQLHMIPTVGKHANLAAGGGLSRKEHRSGGSMICFFTSFTVDQT